MIGGAATELGDLYPMAGYSPALAMISFVISMAMRDLRRFTSPAAVGHLRRNRKSVRDDTLPAR